MVAGSRRKIYADGNGGNKQAKQLGKAVNKSCQLVFESNTQQYVIRRASRGQTPS